MANKNNNTKSRRLASAADDDPTAELEALSDTFVATGGTPAARENNEHTCSFDETDEVDELPVARLRSDLRNRNESIHKLQYDIEQLRSRWSGLEKEIKAREEISDNLNRELRELKQRLTDQQARHTDQDKINAGLRDELAARNAQLADALAELDALRAGAGTGAARIAVLEMQQTSDATAIQMLEDELQRLRDLLARQSLARESEVTASHDRELQSLRDELQRSQTALSDLTQYVDGRKAAWYELRADLSSKDRRLAEQARQIEALSAQAAATDARSPADTTAADHDLQYAASVAVPDAHRHAEIRELQAQIHRTESYADALRQQLQDARQDAERRGADHLQMEQALDNALEQMRELRAQLEDERLTKADIEQQKEALQRRYDGEIHGLRSELDEAQLAIADQRGTNEQLAAELLQSNDSGRALQDRLDDAERQLNKRQTEMQQQIGRQRQQIDELRDKIESKDKAISALLNELAHKSSAIDSLDEIGHAVHDLDDRMLASLDDRDIGDRERSTRLLVGTIDGQKLRFPLFKDRLTIGRGADNDIQLKTPCISRRHAVIVSDGRVCRIEDQGSRNGVYVNGTRTLDAVLANGDELVIGTAVLTFEERSKH